MIASGLCLLFIAGEVTGGYLSGSLAIMSDAAHMFSDFASFLVSLFAIHLGTKKSTRKFTFGLYRAEVLGALITVMIIWFVTGVLLYLAVQRLGMVSHKMSLITIFGHKHFRQKFNLTFFTKKFQQPLILVHIWY